MLVVLLGYMGSGKSTVGRMLAEALGVPFADLDSYIEERLQQRIPEVFASMGEIYFRKKEHELLREFLESGKSAVLALGGGTPCYAGNMDLVLSHTQNVFYLQLSVSSLAIRLQKEKEHRPLIAHLSDQELPEFIGKHLFERSPFYSLAPKTVVCNYRQPEEVVSDVLELLDQSR